MSYEAFRADLVSHLSQSVPVEQLPAILAAVDRISGSWEFSPKHTEIIPASGLPGAVRMYIASKSVENVKKGTLSNYLSALTRFFEFVRHPVDEVTTNDIRMYLHWYKETYHVMDSTLAHLRTTLNSFFEWCLEEELVRKNPVRRVQQIRCGDPERLPMTALELEKVRNACATLREKAMVDFLYSTAARAAEFCDLTRRCVSFTDHTVRIEHGKGDKGRTTYLNAESEVSLRAYLDSRTDDSEALFVTIRRPYRKMTKKAVADEIARIVARCDLSVKVTPHVFRHTAASLALQRGMPIEQVQRFLGHAKIQTTLRYAKILNVDVKNSHSKYVA